MLTVLLSVYVKENPKYLDSALTSIWDSQSFKPAQIVLVIDGLLTEMLNEVVSIWKLKLGEILTIVPLEKNVGLGAALNIGLQSCKYELVARMDTDDIAMPDRFFQQLTFMNNNPSVAVSSGLIEEWSQNLTNKISIRELPLLHKDILLFAKTRSPISHPAVIFRKAAVLSVGGYPNMYPEDYPLWGAMLANGHIFANLPDLLLKMRVGDALIERRGKDFLIGEIQTFNYLSSVGFLTKYELYRNIMQRSVVRLSPIRFKRFLYKYFR